MSDDPEGDDASAERTADGPTDAAGSPEPQAEEDEGVEREAIINEGMIDDPIGDEPSDGDGEDGAARQEWREGRDEAVPDSSWLSLDDDDLLLRIETLGSEADEDEQLLEVVASTRHFFIRQEAAKRVHDRKRLFAFEDDRHVGQILVRHLTRREDLTYLERLAIRCRHVEVRSAAQVQLARVWRWLDSSAASAPPSSSPTPSLPPKAGQAVSDGALTAAAVARDGVDASLLCWAAHFIVEQAWGHLGTTASRELLRRSQQDLLGSRPTLALFRVGDDARVATSIPPGARLPGEAVRDLAAWMVAFRAAAHAVAPEIEATSIRGCTALMADALREVGFYSACDQAESARTS